MVNAQKSIDNYSSILSRLMPGQWYCYHVGFLARDRIKQYIQGCVAEAAYEAYQNGRVILIQRKLDIGVYEYFAVGRRKEQ